MAAFADVMIPRFDPIKGVYRNSDPKMQQAFKGK